MKGNKQTDKNLRHLEATSLIMPSDHIWGNIEHTLDAKNAKKGLWIWSFGILCCLGGLGVLLSNSFFSTYEKSTDTLPNNTPRELASIAPVLEANGEAATYEILEEPREKTAASPSAIDVIKNTSNISNNSILRSEDGAYETEQNTPAVDLSIKSQLPNTTKAEAIQEYHEETTKVSGSERMIQGKVHQKDTAYNEDDLNKEILDDPCPALNSKMKKHFFVEVGAVLGRHSKQFRNSSEGITQLREDTETSWYTWGGFAGLGIYLQPNLYISTNLELIQQKDLFNYSRDGISRMIVEYDPATGEQLSSHTVSGSWTSEGEITRTTVDGSFNVGYIFGKGQASRNVWQFGIEPGLIYNFQLTSKGKVMTGPNDISRLENEEMYQNNLGLGYQVHLIATKNLKKGMQLNLKPFYRSYLNSWSNSGSDELNIPSVGLRLGVRKIF